MQKSVLYLVVLTVFTVTFPVAAAESQKQSGSQINWLNSIDQAIEQAKAQNKPILIDFFNPE